MIASDLESLLVRLLLGGALDARRRGQQLYESIRPHVDGLLLWCETPGVTDAARAEMAAL